MPRTDSCVSALARLRRPAGLAGLCCCSRGAWAGGSLTDDPPLLFLSIVCLALIGAVLLLHARNRQKKSLLAALREAKENLRQSEFLFRSQFDLSNIGMAITAPDRHWLRVNPCLCAMLGYSESELQQKTWSELTHPDDLAADLDLYERTLRGEIDRYELEKRFRRHDGGDLSVHLTVACFRQDGRTEYFIISVLDISEHKEAYQALARLNMELEGRVAERTAQLEETNLHLTHALSAAEAANLAKSIFLANMSHELRTPLNAVIGFSRLMVGSDNLSSDEKRNLEIINRAGNHLLTLINDVLELSKIEAGRIQLNEEQIDLPEMLGDIVDLLRERAEQSGLQLRLDVSGLPATVRCDGIKLKQILINLLGNAIKFTAGGCITLEVRAGEAGERHSRIDFAVIDTGPGIALDDQQRIFEPFVQLGAPTSAAGTGLGLTICRQYLRLMGSELALQSTPGQGAAFRFTLNLPVAQALTASARKNGEHFTLAPEYQGKRILIVEDTEDARLLISSLLEPMGFVVAEAGDGLEALDQLETFAPDLILMDWRMPRLDGIAATRQIRSQGGITQPRIVMLTANAFEEDRLAALAAGADDYLRKPLDGDSLFTVLENQLGIRFAPQPPEHGPRVTAAAPGPEAMATLPETLRAELRIAVKELNQAKILEALRPVAESHPALFAHIAHLAEEFHFQKLWQLLDGDRH